MKKKRNSKLLLRKKRERINVEISAIYNKMKKEYNKPISLYEKIKIKLKTLL